MSRSRSAASEKRAPFGAGYPLRDEALDEPANAPAAPLQPERVETSEARPRRRWRPPASPWPIFLLILLLLAGLGAAYAVTHRIGPHPARAGQRRPASASSPSAHSGQKTTKTPTSSRTAPTPTTTSHATSRPVTPSRSTVPRVVGYQLDRAIGMLRQAGLTPLVQQVPSVAPTGRVIGQNPRAGANEAKDGRVRLDVSLQPLVVIPDVVGMRGITASHTLIADHLLVSLRYVASRQPPRTVIAQYPTAGGKVKRGTSVEINISTGAGSSGPTGAPASGPPGAGSSGPTGAGPSGPTGASTG